MKYTVKDFRFTDQGWVADVMCDNASLPLSLRLDEVNAQDCHNFQQAYITVSCLPFGSEFGYQMDVIQTETRTVSPNAVLLGPQEPPQDYRIWNTRQPDETFKPLSQFFDEAVQKADVASPDVSEMEADAQEFRDVKFGSKQWFDNVEEIPF